MEEIQDQIRMEAFTRYQNTSRIIKMLKESKLTRNSIKLPEEEN